MQEYHKWDIHGRKRDAVCGARCHPSRAAPSPPPPPQPPWRPRRWSGHRRRGGDGAGLAVPLAVWQLLPHLALALHRAGGACPRASYGRRVAGVGARGDYGGLKTLADRTGRGTAAASIAHCPRPHAPRFRLARPSNDDGLGALAGGGEARPLLIQAALVPPPDSGARHGSGCDRRVASVGPGRPPPPPPHADPGLTLRFPGWHGRPTTSALASRPLEVRQGPCYHRLPWRRPQELARARASAATAECPALVLAATAGRW